MKRTISFLGWASVVFMIVSLFLTLIGMYSCYYIKYFNTYYSLQWCIFYTMLIWAVKLFDINCGGKRYVYPIICLLFAVGAIFFRYMRVY